MKEKLSEELVCEMVLHHAKRIMSILLDNGYDLETVKGSEMDDLNIYIHRHGETPILEVCNTCNDVLFQKKVREMRREKE